MKVVLLPIQTNSYFTTLFPIAQILKKRDSWKPIIVFTVSYPTLKQHVESCRAEQIEFILEPGVAIGNPAGTEREPKPEKKTLQRLPAFLRSPLKAAYHFLCGLLFQNVVAIFLRMRKRQRIIRELIRSQQARLLVLAGDLIDYDTGLFVRSAHREGISAVVVPAWMAGPREATESVKDKPQFSCSRWTNRLFGYFRPNWVHEHNGKRLLREPAAQALAMEWLNVAPPRPWVLHSGYSDAIAVESEAMRQYGIREGLPAKQLVLTGSVVHDGISESIQLASERRAELLNVLGLPPNRPVLLTALPPDQLAYGRSECEFQNYKELIQFWMNTLVQAGDCNIVVSLHPSVRPGDMAYVEESGAKISREPVWKLIPLCDVYIASISATIQWAIACSKPVINYDVYQYRYPDYLGVRGVVGMEKKQQFVEAVNRVTSNAGYRKELEAAQAQHAKDWGNLDGHASDRLIGLFEHHSERPVSKERAKY